MASGAYHAPCIIEATPGMMRGVTVANIRISPRLLVTFTLSPFLIPRAAASMGLIQTASVIA